MGGHSRCCPPDPWPALGSGADRDNAPDALWAQGLAHRVILVTVRRDRAEVTWGHLARMVQDLSGTTLPGNC